MTTEEQVRILSVITTYNEAGKHFTEVYFWSDLVELQECGLLEIHLPVHATTGLRYSEKHYYVEVTEEGRELVSAHLEYWPD